MFYTHSSFKLNKRKLPILANKTKRLNKARGLDDQANLSKKIHLINQVSKHDLIRLSIELNAK